MPTQNERTITEPAEAEVMSAPRSDGRPPFYDRSSLSGDYLVMIADQTVEDFFRYAPESRFCEYFDGIVYMPSPVRNNHQEIVVFLTDLFNGLRWERGSGQVLTGPAVLCLSETRFPEPDIFVLKPGVVPAPEIGVDHESAVLVVEVLSPSNRNHDLVMKAERYREAGIPEIWYVDDRDQVLHVDRRVGGTYQTDRLSGGIHRSSAIPGFWIDVAWLWADSLPNPRACLRSILAGTDPV